MVRKQQVDQGTTGWQNTGKNQWEVYSKDDFSHFGSHASICNSVIVSPNDTTVIVQEGDTISWYRYGKLMTFIHQKDVYSFHFKPNSQPTSIHDPSIASMIETTLEGNNDFRVVNVLLKPSLTIAQIQLIIQTIKSDAAFEEELASIAHPTMIDNSAGMWINLDDQVTVVFKDANITTTQITAFANKYNVFVTMTPPTNKPTGTHGIYMFQLKPLTDTASHLLAKSMWEGDSTIIQAVEPNIIRFPQPNTTCPINDTYFDYNPQNKSWHIKNDGSLETVGGFSSTSGADAKICDCWSSGYTGTDIKIAVMDYHGFEWTHEDLNGQFIDGWDCINDVAYTSSTTLPAYVFDQYHGTSVSSIVSAIGDNGTGISGVAPDAKIIPLLINGDGTTMNLAYNQMLSLNPDVVNFSFGSSHPDADYSPWHDLIRLDWMTSGRGGKGIVCVASAGNDNSELKQWPAAWDEVIGVIGTNPNDYRHSGGGWGVGASSYGYWYDVAAPGAYIVSATFMGKGTPQLGSNYKNSGGTSFSSPIVAGIAAMVIEKNPTFTHQEVYDAITNTADKVHPHTYDYNEAFIDYPGKSKELGYGRVNCYNAINGIVGIDSVAERAGVIKIVSPVDDNLTVLYYINPSIKKITAKVYDVLGQPITEMVLPSGNNTASIDISSITSGIYIISFYTENGQLIQSNKFVKR